MMHICMDSTKHRVRTDSILASFAMMGAEIRSGTNLYIIIIIIIIIYYYYYYYYHYYYYYYYYYYLVGRSVSVA